jgi:hypothetical protein
MLIITKRPKIILSGSVCVSAERDSTKTSNKIETCPACRFVSLCDDVLNRRCDEENLRKMRQTAMIDDSFCS